MTAYTHYVELTLEPGLFQASIGNRPTIVYWHERVLKILHGVFSSNNLYLPIAFPEYLAGDFSKLGKKIRVFGSRDELLQFRDLLRQNDWVKSSVKIMEVKEVPSVKKMVSFHRIQWPKRNKNTPENYIKKCREFELLPSIKIQSSSNKNWFILGISKKNHHSILENGRIDAYGLSGSITPVVLPDF